MVKSELAIPKVWRSELQSVSIFILFCVLSIILSRKFPGSVLEGPLLDIFSWSIYLSLPLWWLLPFGQLVYTVAKIYNVRYVVDSRGVMSRTGILSLNQRIVRIRYEDIRSIETDQTLLERLLDIGSVNISTAATSSVEIFLNGVSAPKEVQEMLQRESDSRQKMASKQKGQILSEE